MKPAPRVLIVDDDESVRTFVERVLHRAGYETAMAADGPEALRIAETQDPFDLLLADVVMPDMHGDELARRLLRLEPDLKVLYFIGYSDQLFARPRMADAHRDRAAGRGAAGACGPFPTRSRFPCLKPCGNIRKMWSRSRSPSSNPAPKKHSKSYVPTRSANTSRCTASKSASASRAASPGVPARALPCA